MRCLLLVREERVLRASHAACSTSVSCKSKAFSITRSTLVFVWVGMVSSIVGVVMSVGVSVYVVVAMSVGVHLRSEEINEDHFCFAFM